MGPKGFNYTVSNHHPWYESVTKTRKWSKKGQGPENPAFREMSGVCSASGGGLGQESVRNKDQWKAYDVQNTHEMVEQYRLNQYWSNI